MAISTNGWDLVYALRFNEINKLLQQKFESESLFKQKIKQKLALEFVDGYRNNIEAVVDNPGKLYTHLPKASILSIEKNLPSNTKPIVKLKLDKVEVIDSSGITNTSIIKVIPDDKGASVKIGSEIILDQINITDFGNGYQVEPKVTITGGGGTGATATVVLANNKIESITLTNKGQGYTSIPTINIEPPTGTFKKQATASISVKPTLKIEKTGSGFTEIPIISIDGNSNKVKVYTAIDSVIFEKIDSTKDFDTFIVPPQIEITNNPNDTTGKGARIFTYLDFLNIDKIKFDVEKNNVENIFKLYFNGIKIIFNDLINEFDLKILGKIESYIYEYINELFNSFYVLKNINDSNFVQELIIKLTEISYKAFLVNLDFIENQKMLYHNSELVNPELFLIQDAINSINDNKKISIAQNKIIEKHKLDQLSENIKVNLKSELDKLNYIRNLLINEEVNKAKLRVQRVFRSLDATIVFNYNLDATEDENLYYKKCSDIDIKNNSTTKKIFLNTIIEVIVAIIPENYSNQLIALGTINNDLDYPFQKLRLYTGAWQLIPGGNSDKVRINIPVFGGFANFGKQNTLIKIEDNFNIVIDVKLGWLFDNEKTHLKTLKNDSIELIRFKGTKELKNEITKSLIENFISNTLNGSVDILNPQTNHILNPIDYAFAYNHTFSSINIYSDITNTDLKDLAWMYPTYATYAVKDEYGDDIDVNNSILAICCMTEGRKNFNAPEVNLQAIPEGSNSAVLISREILMYKFILPYFTQLFKSVTKDSKKNTIIKDATISDFKNTNNQIFTNKHPFTTLALEIKDKNGNYIIGYIDKEALQIKIENESIIVNLSNVTFNFDNLGNGNNYTLKINKTFGFTFELVDGKLALYPTVTSYNFTPFFEPDENNIISDAALTAAVEIVSLAFTILVLNGALRAKKYFIDKKRGATIKEVGVELTNVKKPTSVDLVFEPKIEDKIIEYNQNINKENHKVIENINKNKPYLEYKTFTEEITIKNIESINNNHGIQFTIKYSKKSGSGSTITNDYINTIEFSIKENRIIKNEIKREGINIDTNQKVIELDEVKIAYDNFIKENVINKFRRTGVEELNLTKEKFEILKNIKPEEIKVEEFSFWKPYKEHFGTITGFSAIIATVITGVFIAFRIKSRENEKEQYRNNIQRGIDNLSQNGLVSLSSFFINKIIWPNFSKQNVTLNNFTLNDSLIIGFNHSENLTYEGTVSVNNPVYPFLYIKAEKITIENLGQKSIFINFIENKIAYQSFFGKKIGNQIEIKQQQKETLLISAFNINDTNDKLLQISCLENENKFKVSI